MKTNTSGVFTVEVNNEEIYVGASTQVEVAFRDYMGWIKKHKAPKAIQAVADEMMEAGKFAEEVIPEFSYKVVIECAEQSKLKELRKLYKELGSAEAVNRALEAGDVAAPEQVVDQPEEQPTVEETPEPTAETPEQQDSPELSIEERNSTILAALNSGQSVASLADEFGVSKSTIYKIKNQ